MTAGGDLPLLSAIPRIFNDNPPGPFAVAVSGGGDSLVLLHLAYQAFPALVRAVTVDHGLRAESAQEAADVAAFCAARRIPHQTLCWQGPGPSGNLMDQARRARLRLIAEWAGGQGIADVLLGHTADDQAETFVMNLARAAGLDGLSGLRPVFLAEGVRFHRPLLGTSRAALRQFLRAEGITWVDDPSNDDDRFTRARVRKVLAALAPLGLDAGTIARSARNLAQVRGGLQAELAEFARARVVEQAGALFLPVGALAELSVEKQRRLMIAALRWIGGADHPPRETGLDQLRARLAAGQGATLAGVRLAFGRAGLTLTREPRAVQPAVPQGALWDGRWRLGGPMLAKATLAALGAEGLKHCPDWRLHGPRAALIVSPALWQEGRLIAAPLAGLNPAYRATLSQGFAEFILSH